MNVRNSHLTRWIYWKRLGNNLMENNSKKITTLAMLCAVAYVVMLVGRIPVVLFLKYDPKDIVITLGGLIWGPTTSFIVSLMVSFIEMITVSSTGIIGCAMNIISSSSFACTAAFIYKKKRTLTGAVIGLFAGGVVMVAVMLLWNYLVTPIYMGYPREAVAELLLPAFLPFNALKAGLNGAITFLLYKPLTRTLRRIDYIPASLSKSQAQRPVGLWFLAALIIVTCILIILLFNGII